MVNPAVSLVRCANRIWNRGAPPDRANRILLWSTGVGIPVDDRISFASFPIASKVLRDET